MPRQVWDPCCGAGDISTVLQQHGHEVISTDLIDRRYGRGGLDFLLQTTALARAIVTNPPFSVPRRSSGMPQSWASITSLFCIKPTGSTPPTAASWSKPYGARHGATFSSGGWTSRTKAHRR